MKPHACLLALLLVPAHRDARAEPAGLNALLEVLGQSIGQKLPDLPAPPATPTATFVEGAAGADGEQVNFSYDEMTTRLDKDIIGRSRRRHGRRGGRTFVIPSGVTPADRVTEGQIHSIVLHSACGTYEGAIATLLSHKTAAHFIVSAQGAVTRMVDIANIANHVKNEEIKRTSIGIETETGLTRAPWFARSDWDPKSRWRFYASLARLIRALAEETHLPTDRAHIITHEEADRGICGGHTDPGPMFDGDSYPEFEQRFPGERVTPREYLMRLVNARNPPDIRLASVASGATRLEISDPQRLGLASMRISYEDVHGGTTAPATVWSAPLAGLPPESLSIPIPAVTGVYRVEAQDMVGNKRSRTILVTVPPAR